MTCRSGVSAVRRSGYRTYCNVEQELAREKLAIERDLGRLVVFGRRVDPTGRTGPRLPIPNERVEVIAISITDSSGIFNRHSQSVIHVGLGGDGLQGNAASPVAGRVRGGDVRLDEAVGEAGHGPG